MAPIKHILTFIVAAGGRKLVERWPIVPVPIADGTYVPDDATVVNVIEIKLMQLSLMVRRQIIGPTALLLR